MDHSQIVQLETLRRGIWGTKNLWGCILTYKGLEKRTTERVQMQEQRRDEVAYSVTVSQ